MSSISADPGRITSRVLYRTEQLAFVQFRTVDWPGYRDFGNYARVALFPDPSSTGSGYLFLDDQVLERLGGRLRHL
jgi:hypothetical protein